MTILGLVATPAANAAPFGAADKNPNVVAHFNSGPHGIPGESEFHEGKDIVMNAGQSGNLQQWFFGTSETEGLHGEHSLWKESKDGCQQNQVLIEDAHPEWGTYLEPGADYCVKTNDFRSSN